MDEARQETNVLLVAAGDIFSGSPIVDQYDPRGYPIIDVMNKTGFDMAVIGNHEFDYGIDETGKTDKTVAGSGAPKNIDGITSNNE